jgi:hypothetical protein
MSTRRSQPTTARTARTAVPIVDVTGRAIPPAVQLRLYVAAGGRCEFDGCNEYVLEHQVTRRPGNFGEAAHIVAFKPDGPRGWDGGRPRKINDAANLMLLCAGCHKLVDDHPEDYSRETLREYKRIHEVRIRHLTSLGPAQRTAVLVVKAPVNGQTVAVPFDHVVEATAPRYPSRHETEGTDLTTIIDGGSAFSQVAQETIREAVDRFFGPGGEGRKAGHASIFALAPIPLLVFLGRQLTNKVPSDLFQRHRDTEKWTWKHGGRTVRYAVKRLRRGPVRSKVALLVSLSGSIRIRDLPNVVRRSATIYSITLEGQTPRPTFLRTREDLERFRTAFQEALGLIGQNHGLLRSIDFFPAVPAPVAVLCGRELLPKVHPALRVWDYDKAKGEFNFQLEV